MKFLIALSAWFLFVSCNERDCCSGIPGDDLMFEFSVVNTLGIDLLNQRNQESFNQSEIRIYNSSGNNTSLVYNENSDAPYGYAIIERQPVYRIRPFFDTKNLDVVGYIQWDETDLDTIKLDLVQQSSNVKRLTSIKFNGVEVWNEKTSPDPNNRYFQIVK